MMLQWKFRETKEKGKEEVISATLTTKAKGGHRIKDKGKVKEGKIVPKIKNRKPATVKYGIKGKTKIFESGDIIENFPKLKIKIGKQRV